MEIKRCYDTIIGATVNVNQLVNKNTLPATNTINGVTFTNNGDGIITVNGTATELTRLDGILGAKTWIAHKYLLIGCPAGGSPETYSIALRGAGRDERDEGSGVLWDASVNPYKGIVIYINPGFAVSNLQFKPQFIDLTALLGTTIADYIYSIETATAGAGIAKLREWGFLRGYQAYNAGSIESVEVTGKKVVGFNQFDKSTITDNAYVSGGTGSVQTGQPEFFCSDFIPCLPNTQYYSNADVNGRLNTHVFYDADKGYISANATANGVFTTPTNAYYMRVNCIKANRTADALCINLSSDRNGEYEAYASQTYDYGDDVLRGIFQLDANNNLYADGDVKTSDGTVTRKYKKITITGDSDIMAGGYGMPFVISIRDKKHITAYSSEPNGICDKLMGVKQSTTWGVPFTFSFVKNAYSMHFKLSDSITTIEDAKTWLASNPITLVYELATPTTEQSTPFTSPQIVYPDGTEEYVTSNGVPVGHETRYEL